MRGAGAAGRSWGRKGLESTELAFWVLLGQGREGEPWHLMAPGGGDLGVKEWMCWSREVRAGILTGMWVFVHPSVCIRLSVHPLAFSENLFSSRFWEMRCALIAGATGC